VTFGKGRWVRLWLPAYFVVAVAVPLAGSRYLVELVLSLNLYLIFVLSWDLFCGPLRETNFGHSLFIGGAAYLSAWLSAHQVMSPLWSVLAALGVVALVGGGVGWVAARFRGPSFALATMALQLMMFQAVFLFPGIFGAEEGILGVPPLVANPTWAYLLITAAAAGVAGLRAYLHRSNVGLSATALGDDEDLARSCGISATALKVGLFTISVVLGGLGGVLYAHTQGQVNSELVSSSLSVQIVLLGLVGGARSGPAASVLLFFLLQRALSGVVPAAALVYGLFLVTALMLFPQGLLARDDGGRAR